MKSLLQPATLLLAPMFLFFSCKKEYSCEGCKPDDNKPPTGKIVNAKVIEYGSDLPIEGAILNVCTTAIRTQNGFECAGNYSSFVTDSKGECFFRTDSIYKFPWNANAVLKDGYEELFEPRNPCLFEYNKMERENFLFETFHADSFIIRKVPYRYITLHVKNIANQDPGLELHFRAIYHSRFTNNTCYSGFMGMVYLRQGIDTTFQYLAYGNMGNEYIIAQYADHDDGTTIIGKVYQEIVYIPKTGDVTVEILY